MTANPAPPAQAPHRSVLLVEDDLALRDYLASALRDQHYGVHLAHDHASAMACMSRADAPALVLLDLGLPPHPSTAQVGLRTLQSLLQMQPATKVLVLTGQSELAAAHQAVRAGAFDFLTKPAPLSAVLQALHRASLFAREEAQMAQAGEARLSITARVSEGLKEAGSQVEEQLLRRSFAAAGYNVAEVARQLGLAREQVYYYLNKYGIRRPD